MHVLAALDELVWSSDGRFAVHAHQDAAAPSEFSIRGRAVRITESAVRDMATRGLPFEVDDSHWLFGLRIEAAVIGRWPAADDLAAGLRDLTAKSGDSEQLARWAARR